MKSGQQRTCASIQSDINETITRQHAFLHTIKDIGPWLNLIRLIELPCLRPQDAGYLVTSLVWTLKGYLLGIWYNVSYLQTKKTMHERCALQDFLDSDLDTNLPPDEMTILRLCGIDETLQYADSAVANLNMHFHRDTLQRKKHVSAGWDVNSALTAR